MSENKTNIIIKTLEEQGDNLPLGIIDQSGGYSREIAFRRWNLKRNEELRKKQKQKGKGPMSMFRYAAIVLSEMCTRIGPHNFESMNSSERILEIYKMYHGDVMFAYMALRRDAMGEDIYTDIECPRCNNKFSFCGDLNTLPVRTAETLVDAQWKYDLKDPFPLRDMTVESLSFQPVRWSSIERSKPIDESKIESMIVIGSIFEVNGQPMDLVDGDLDEIGKRDFEEILYLTGNNSIGPDMSIDCVCNSPMCGYEWKIAIDWTYDNFFAITSR